MSNVNLAAFRALPEPLQRACQDLTLMPDPAFSTAAAADTLQAAPEITRTTLNRLQAAHLLEQPEPDQWRMPKPVRTYGHTLLEDVPEAERARIVARIARHYLLWAAGLDRLIAPGRRRVAAVFTWHPETPPAAATAEQALALLHTRAPTLVAAQAQAADAGLHHLAWQYLDALWGYLTRQHNYRAWRKVCRVGDHSAHYLKDPTALALWHSLSGLLGRHCGFFRRALDHHNQTERRVLDAGDTLTQAAAAEHQGATLLRLNQPQKALEVLQRGLALYQAATIPHQRGQALLERQLAIALAKLGEGDQAKEHFRAVETVFGAYDELYLCARLGLDRAQVALDAEDPASALGHLAQAEQRFSGWSDPDRARLLYLSAAAHTLAGDQDTAARARAAAIPLAQQLPRNHPIALLIQTLTNHSPGTTE
ncbi:tetratricopeptide repeat protein [Actinomadura sp. NPDC048955]|uniref:tetratricopeptide repeat protein n=1 Tax=Actinomadura sp. NPDC048955 TaxID=3158228 RepID=UPI0033F623F4